MEYHRSNIVDFPKALPTTTWLSLSILNQSAAAEATFDDIDHSVDAVVGHAVSFSALAERLEELSATLAMLSAGARRLTLIEVENPVETSVLSA